MLSKRWMRWKRWLAAIDRIWIEAVTNVAIVGAGLVGCCAACAIADAGFSVTLVDLHPNPRPTHEAVDPLTGERPIALAAATARVLDRLGVWSGLRPFVEPIRRIQVSDQGHHAFVHLNATALGLSAFGYVTDAKALLAALTQAVQRRVSAINVVTATAIALDTAGEDRTLHLQAATGTLEMIRVALVVAADGSQSPCRQWVGIGANVQVYEQQAVICNVTLEQDHGGQAFERFTTAGPVALLPMTNGRYGVIWTMSPAQAAEAINKDDGGFCTALQSGFGSRLGPIIAVGRRRIQELVRMTAHAITAPGVAIIGNAAHQLHPVAGQGFNLGLRDAIWLAESCATAQRQRIPLGSADHLRNYARSRRDDHQQISGFTHCIVELFSNRLMPIALVRGVGLWALEYSPWLQRAFVHHATGLASTPARYRMVGAA